ncbi:bifunctionaluridylyltransferase/uridylyl-removing enzyme, partial [Striga asiatica]
TLICIGLKIDLPQPIKRCKEKDYSVVTVKCKDRLKLMFDSVCTLTAVQYVVFHTTISSDGPYASQVRFQIFLLFVTRAGVSTVGEQAVDVFYVRDASEKSVDAKTIEGLVHKKIGQIEGQREKCP